MAASGSECCGAGREGGLCLPTPRRHKAGVYVSRVPGGPPDLLLTWSPFLMDWDAARSSLLRRPRRHASLLLSAACLAPHSIHSLTGAPAPLLGPLSRSSR